MVPLSAQILLARLRSEVMPDLSGALGITPARFAIASLCTFHLQQPR